MLKTFIVGLMLLGLTACAGTQSSMNAGCCHHMKCCEQHADKAKASGKPCCHTKNGEQCPFDGKPMSAKDSDNSCCHDMKNGEQCPFDGK